MFFLQHLKMIKIAILSDHDHKITYYDEYSVYKVI